MISNHISKKLIGKPDLHLVGKKLIEELPSFTTEGLLDKYIHVVENNIPLHAEYFMSLSISKCE